MSEKFASLVYGLRALRPAVYDSAAAIASRHRFVLVTIAVHADDEGCCRADIPMLSGWTGYTPKAVRTSIQFNRDENLVTSTYVCGGLPVFQLVEDELRRRQSAKPQLGDSVYALVEFGLPEATADRVAGAGWRTVEALGEELAIFEEQPESVKCRGLGAFLRIPFVGEGKAAQILSAYDGYKRSV